jgi:hypothetical protein
VDDAVGADTSSIAHADVEESSIDTRTLAVQHLLSLSTTSSCLNCGNPIRDAVKVKVSLVAAAPASSRMVRSPE